MARRLRAGDVWHIGKKTPTPRAIAYSLPSAQDRERAEKQREWPCSKLMMRSRE
jgi:hypothetical protein